MDRWATQGPIRLHATKTILQDVYEKIAITLDVVELSLDKRKQLARGVLGPRAIENISLRIEALKANFRARFSRHLFDEDPNGAHGEILQLIGQLEALTFENEIGREFSRIPFEYPAIMTRAPEMANLLLVTGGGSIRDALRDLVKLLTRLEFIPADGEVNPQNLSLFLPGQKLSPVQFAIRDGKLVISPQPLVAEAIDAQNIQESREKLQAKGLELINELQRSNCDRRLLLHVAELQKALESQSNIIQLGLTNIGCETMCAAFKQELPDAIWGMMVGHTRGIAMYIGQFPDWQRFVENASTAELEHDDIKRISDAARSIVEGLEAHPEIADVEVPKTIKAIKYLVDNPGKALKRAAFALMRTIENLIEKAFGFAIEVAGESFDKAKSPLSAVGSKVIVVTILTIALGGTAYLSPLGAKIAEISWVQSAEDIAKAQIKRLAP